MCTLHDFSVLKSNLFIRALLLDRILVTEKLRVRLAYILYNKGSTLAENIRYLMYKYDITINDWHQSLNYVIKKVYAYDNDRTNCNDTCTANVIREHCHDRDTYHYPVNKDDCSEFNDFLKALCTL